MQSFTALTALVVACLRLQGVLAEDTFDSDATQTPPIVQNLPAQNATVFSLMYGYPLRSFAGAAKPIISAVGYNALENNRYLETAADEGGANQVVDPNEDTVYSAIVYDLSQNDVIIHVPDIPFDDYFVLFSFYDPYGDNFASAGSRNFNESGEWRLRYDNSTTSYGISKADCGPYVANIDTPSAFGIIDIRYLVYNDSSYPTIHKWQNDTKLTLVPKPPARKLPVTLKQALAVPQDTTPALNVLQLLANFAPWCPAFVPADRPRVDAYLKKAGIANGQYQPPANVDLVKANTTALANVQDATEVRSRYIDDGNGWVQLAPRLDGNFSTAYGLRTGIALTGYLQLTARNALYLTFNNGSTGGLAAATAFTVGPQEALLYTFSGRPPLYKTGFWSLTVYQDNFLIPNQLNRSALGDRSNITFPDGRLVYDDHGYPFSSTKDGPFQLLIQPADVPPPKNWTSNWIPAPRGGGSDLSVLLRTYDGIIAPLTNGSYVYPVVKKQAAITQN